MFFNKKSKSKARPELTFREKEHLELIELKNEALINAIKIFKLSEINRYYWLDKVSSPEQRSYYSGIQFCGYTLDMESFLKLKESCAVNKLNIYMSGSDMFNKRWNDFHFFGHDYEEIINIEKSYYVILPTYYEEQQFMGQIYHALVDTPIPYIYKLWKEKYKAELIWFDSNYLKMYLKEIPETNGELKQEIKVLLNGFIDDEERMENRVSEFLTTLPLLSFHLYD